MNEAPPLSENNQSLDIPPGARVAVPESVIQLGESRAMVSAEGGFSSEPNNNANPDSLWRIDSLNPKDIEKEVLTQGTVTPQPPNYRAERQVIYGDEKKDNTNHIGSASEGGQPVRHNSREGMSISELAEKGLSPTPSTIIDLNESGESFTPPKAEVTIAEIAALREESREISSEFGYGIKKTEEKFEKLQKDIMEQRKEVLEKAEDLARDAAREISRAEEAREKQTLALKTTREELEAKEAEIDRSFNEAVNKSNEILASVEAIIAAYKNR